MKRTASLILSVLLLLSFSYTTFAYVNEGWDWHLVDGQPKRTIHYCAGNALRYVEKGRTVDVQALTSGLSPSFATWLTEAVNNINEANTGWTFTPSALTFPPCQVLIAMADFSEDNHNGGVSTPVDTNGDGKADLVRIVIDESLENTLENLPEDQDTQDGNRDGWSTVSTDTKTRDPVGVLMHELTHALRLDHHPDSKHSDTTDNDISDPRPIGDHNTTLSEEDLKEMRDSAGTVEKVGQLEIQEDTQNVSYANVNIEIPENAFEFYPAYIDLNIYDGVAIPDPLAINYHNDWDAFTHILGSGTINLRTDQPLLKPLKVSIPYTDDELKGGDTMYVGDLHGYIPVPIDESTMRAFSYQLRSFGVESEDPSHWVVVENSQVDTENNKVTFETNETGVFGISGMEGSSSVSIFNVDDNNMFAAVIVTFVGATALLFILKKRRNK